MSVLEQSNATAQAAQIEPEINQTSEKVSTVTPKDSETIVQQEKEKPKKKKSSKKDMLQRLTCKNPFAIFLCLSSPEKMEIDEKAPISPQSPTKDEVTTDDLNTTATVVSAIKPSSPDSLIYSASPDAQQDTTLIPEKSLPDPKRFSTSSKKYLLEPLLPEFEGKKCLVLDLDETLVHSSFKLIDHPDFIVPVEIDNQIHNVYVAKRPGVDEFLQKVGEIFEIVVFTASLSKYADPVLDMLDRHKVIQHRLFRESCYNHNGNYVKDLSQIGRDLKDTIIIDNSPTSYLFHPANAVPITTWFNDVHDTELLDLIPFLKDLSLVDDVTKVLDNNHVDIM